jgi:isopentenyl diphosphate isomerase/L-lactate dehydrogenase-like FMN-dependent dehydrogenase
MTDLPVLLKGMQTVEDAKLAHDNGVPVIILSNHRGRQLDTARHSPRIALEIHREAPELFDGLEVFAGGGIRYGPDTLKLLSLGVKAIGCGRPFMFSNIYGQEGLERAIEILEHEIAIDAANPGRC